MVPVVRTLLLIAALAAGLVLAACGESEEEQAKDDVCDARADMQNKLDELGSLTLTSASIDQVRELFEGIGEDVREMADAQPELDDERKEQVQSANQQFEAAARDALDDILSGTSSDQAQDQLESAVSTLASSYREAYGPIDCG